MTDLPDPYDSDDDEHLSELARSARAALREGDDKFRQHYTNVLILLINRLSDEHLREQQSHRLIPHDVIGALYDISLAFMDHGMGRANKLFSTKRGRGRRKRDAFVQIETVAILAIAELCLERGRADRKSREASFRQAASLMRQRGCPLRWQEVRSHWNNRKRLDPIPFMHFARLHFLLENEKLQHQPLSDLADFVLEELHLPAFTKSNVPIF